MPHLFSLSSGGHPASYYELKLRDDNIACHKSDIISIVSEANANELVIWLSHHFFEIRGLTVLSTCKRHVIAAGKIYSRA